MPSKVKIPPRFFSLKSDGSAYVVVRYDDGFFDVVYYRQYRLGEDDITDEYTAQNLHKRFAITKRKLVDALRVVFAEGAIGDDLDWDADMVEWMIRQDPRVPKFPGAAFKDDEQDEPKQEEKPQWVPLTRDEQGQLRIGEDLSTTIPTDSA